MGSGWVKGAEARGVIGLLILAYLAAAALRSRFSRFLPAAAGEQAVSIRWESQPSHSSWPWLWLFRSG
jgi:hypothetical protein